MAGVLQPNSEVVFEEDIPGREEGPPEKTEVSIRLSVKRTEEAPVVAEEPPEKTESKSAKLSSFDVTKFDDVAGVTSEFKEEKSAKSVLDD